GGGGGGGGGRVEVVPGEYVVGWAKRGPSGVIGTNKADAAATVELMREDLEGGVAVRTAGGAPDLADLLRERGVHWVDHEGWKRLDAHETASGKAEGRPRVKLCSVAEMLEVAGRPG
ncbi:MAG: ferredoxin, partial [Gemmatimonadetes bacterium]|nr:ferredoxin [Gemmatimonadota bacterium]